MQPGGPMGGERQLPPQLVGRTVKETYPEGGEGRTVHHGYIPPPGTQQGYRANSGVYDDPRGGPQGNNVSYFQNVIDPQGQRGGRIE